MDRSRTRKLNDQSKAMNSPQVSESATTVAPLCSTTMEQHLGEIECWAVDYLRSFVQETDASALETHILDLGDGVRIYQLKPNAPKTAELAIEAIHKCKLVEGLADQVNLDASAQAFFQLGRIFERFITSTLLRGENGSVPVTPSVPVTQKVAVTPDVDVTQETQDTRSKNILQQLKRRAAEDAISNAISANPGLDEKQAITRAASALNIAPRTLRKWRQFQ